MPAESSRAVFLSYASQDAAAARSLCGALRAAGAEVWFDENELVGGDAWDAKIRRQIKECALFVPVISIGTQARAEGYFRREWKLAVDRTNDLADHVAFLLPVVIDGTTDREAHVPEKFREVQWTRVRSPEAEAAFARQVIKLLGPPAAPRPAPVAPAAVASPVAGPKGRRSRWPVAVALTLAVTAAGGGLWLRSARLHRAQEAEYPLTASIDTAPEGAEVSVKDYYQPQSAWRHLGKTPLHDVRLAKGYARWKIEKEGYAPLERAQAPDSPIHFDLDSAAAIPADMVKVDGGSVKSIFTGFPAVTLDAFLIDRYEVTNREFKAFVDQHGYQNAAFWKQPFVRAGRTLPLPDALAEFHDSTGQPGPAGWKQGTYPDDAADLPVTGISWFEAAAYAEFAGKRLPSVYHWRVAAQVAEYESLVSLSNFAGKGLARAGTYQGMSEWGAYDMAGNAKEWCWNAGSADTRYVLGGAWRESVYMFAQRDAQSPFDRSAEFGFRCMKLIGAHPVPPELDAEMRVQLRDYTQERPVSDEVFQAFLSTYSYDKSPLDVRTDGTDDTDPRWHLEKISFKAAYGNERVPAFVFLPKTSVAPYQTVIYFPTTAAQFFRSLNDYPHDISMIAMLVASGRAVICPVYQGTFERYDRTQSGTGLRAARDELVMVAKDFGRTIDYLETRPDIQTAKLAFFGYSAGGNHGTILPAIEPRLKASILVAAGFVQGQSLPESDPINFAPRDKVPTLMLNGRYDFARPVETSQNPMFKLLGAPPDQKRQVLYETGHTLRPEQVASEVYVWLDRYLGMVR